MNVLVLGSGGREHTLTWSIKKSPKCDNIYVAPGNAGTSSIAENLDFKADDFESIASCVSERNIDLVVVGPEDPLVKGISDFLNERFPDLLVVGPGKEGAQLEGSKDFSKRFMQRHQIPTAAYSTFTPENIEEGFTFLREQTPPYVLKADGLAAGKGVIISKDIHEAEATLKEMLLDSKFGDASARVVIEEFLDGIELSVFVLTDGKDYVILPEAKDYKRIGEQDQGPNTGGMGAVSPVPFASEAFMQKVKDQIIEPTIRGLEEENISYKGFIFFGLINVGGEPKVIEYNARMGDPETQAVLPRVKTDLLDLLVSTARGELGNHEIDIDSDFATTVVMVSGGYPGSYDKGKVIHGLEDPSPAEIFHAGTLLKEGQVLTNGGRVLAFTGRGKDIHEALERSYNAIENVNWEEAFFRKDIGKDLI